CTQATCGGRITVHQWPVGIADFSTAPRTLGRVAEPSRIERVEPQTVASNLTPAVVPRDASPFDRLFGSRQFFRLWLSQVASSLGDWIGLIAITALAARIGGSGAGAAVGLVLSARLIPGFFLGSVAGVISDRWDRRRL